MTVTVHFGAESESLEKTEAPPGISKEAMQSMKHKFDRLKVATISSPSSKKKHVFMHQITIFPGSSPVLRRNSKTIRKSPLAELTNEASEPSISPSEDEECSLKKKDDLDENQNVLKDSADSAAKPADAITDSAEGSPGPNVDVNQNLAKPGDETETLHNGKPTCDDSAEHATRHIKMLDTSQVEDLEIPEKDTPRFHLHDSDDDINDDTDDSDKSKASPRRPKWKIRKPKLDNIEEEHNSETTRLQRYSDSMNGAISGLTLIVRLEMENYTRYRCLAQVEKIPSQRLFSKFYSTRPYLLSYTQWLASEGIYRSRSISLKNHPGLGRRASTCPSPMTTRRGSLSLLGSGPRRGSLKPDLVKFVTSKSVSTFGEKRASRVSALDADDMKLIQEKYEKGKGKKSGGLFDVFFCCVSRKSKDIPKGQAAPI